MASPNDIRRLLRHVLSLSLAPLVAACGIDTSEFDTVACDPGDGTTRYLAGLQPAVPADYIELRGVSEDGTTFVDDQEGTLCLNATNKSACEIEISGATSLNKFQLGDCAGGLNCPTDFLIVNAGDDVTIIDTVDGVKKFLGTIDTKAEAVLVTALAGYTVACGNRERGGVKTDDEYAFEVLGTKQTSSCTPVQTNLYVLGVSANGDVKDLGHEVIHYDENACAGRRPAGFSKQIARGSTRVGAFFAQIARLEAASVGAFAHVERELAHHGAPRSLVLRARAARRDEVRHARVMRHLASRYGGKCSAPRVGPRAPRSLEEMALDNATEGCIRETFGALLGMWQAQFAKDPEVRRVMQEVASDEARHAELSWAIDAWIQPMLSAEAQERLAEAQRAAIAEILEHAEHGYDPEICAAAGMPGVEATRELARNFAAAIEGITRESA